MWMSECKLMCVCVCVCVCIRHIRVSIWPIRKTGSSRYMTKCSRKATSHDIVILMNIRGKETLIAQILFSSLNTCRCDQNYYPLF